MGLRIYFSLTIAAINGREQDNAKIAMTLEYNSMICLNNLEGPQRTVMGNISLSRLSIG
jgi:hypothetical protein